MKKSELKKIAESLINTFQSAGRESIKLAPPLVITEDGLMEGLEVLEQAIKDSIQLL